jgi:hypothetical protein
VIAWMTILLNVLVAALLGIPALMILSAGLPGAGRTESPEQYGAAMIFAMLGGLTALFAALALGLAVASWFLSRRLRQRPAGPGTIAFFVLAGLGPLALIVFGAFFL